jgi:DNA-binding response OmpR family regulator
MRVLLVANPEKFRLAELETALERKDAVTVSVPPASLTRAATQAADIMILDPGLPNQESMSICRKVRASSDISIIMISDSSEKADEIRGLRSGADYYVTYPYDFDELVAKIIAATRPRGHLRNGLSRQLTKGHFGDITIDLERMQVTVAGVAAELTKTEFQILTLIAGADGAVCPREKLATQVWGRPEEEVYESIQVMISRLRAKVGHERIKTVRSVGYQLIMASN